MIIHTSTSSSPFADGSCDDKNLPETVPKIQKTLKSQHTFYTFESSLIDHEDDFDPP